MNSLPKVTNSLRRIATELQVAHGEIVTKFLIERAVARLMQDPMLHDNLVFKGGFVLLSLYDSPRHTKDLDAVLVGKSPEIIHERIKQAMQKDMQDCTWFLYEDMVDLVTQNEYGGTRFQFRAGLLPIAKDIKRAQILNIDIGTGDPVTPGPIETLSHSLIGDDSISWRVYPIETVIAEKLHPLVALGQLNSRSKDIFDLHILLPKADTETLKKALARTFEYRGTPLPHKFSSHLSQINTNILQRGWKAAVATVRAHPDFDTAFEKVIELLEGHGL